MNKEMKQGISKYKFLFILKFFISCLVRGSLLTIPIFYSYAVQEITNGNLEKAYFLLIFLLGFMVFYYISEIINDYVYEKLYYKLSMCISKIGLKYTEKNSIHSLSRIPLGEYHSIMTADINSMADCYGSVPMALARICELVFVLVFFFSINNIIGLAVSLIFILVITILYFGNKRVNQINIQDKATHDQRLGILQEYFLGMEEVKGFRLFKAINRRIEKIYCIYLKWHIKYGFSKAKYKFGALGTVDVSKILFLFYGFYLIKQGQVPIGTILLAYSYFDKLVTSFTGLLDFNNQLQNATVAKKRLLKLEEYTFNKNQSGNQKMIARGSIEFSDVLYGDRKEPILNHFTAHFTSNNITAITGLAGSGKTGVVDLLLKLNKQHDGTIKIDKVDINEYNDETYFADVAAVRKNPTFFHMSIRDNLQIIEANFEKIVAVCEEVGVHDDIMKLRDGYDTIISESASNVSNNIKYLLSIVRVLLKRPKILLFDETLNAFPKEVDLELMNYFRKTKGRHTVIIISNEKHVIEDADAVVYMEKGMTLAHGKHDVLLLKNEQYRNYFNEL